MKYPSLLILGFFMIPRFLPGQTVQRQVLAIGGSSFQSSAIQVNATVGETVIGSLYLDDLYYSQGFQQADKLGCSLLPSVTSLAAVSCFGGDDGWLSVEVPGGAGPYTFLWSDGANSQNRVSVAAGVYAVTVTDASGCAAVVSTFIEEPDSFFVMVDTFSNTLAGQQNGVIGLTVSGGTPPYSYDWKGPNGFSEGTEDIDSLEPGMYDFVVTDNNGCDGVFAFLVETATATHQPNWLQNIRFWPNPVKTELNLAFPGKLRQQMQIHIYDILGREVHQQIIYNADGTSRIILGNSAPGVLQVVFNWNDQTGSIKLVQQP